MALVMVILSPHHPFLSLASQATITLPWTVTALQLDSLYKALWGFRGKGDWRVEERTTLKQTNELLLRAL